MKIIKKKNKPLIMAVLAGVLVILIVTAIILNAVLNKEPEPEPEEPIEILPGEDILNKAAVAYPQIKDNKFISIRIEGESTKWQLLRSGEDTKVVEVVGSDNKPVLDDNGNKVTEKVNEGVFWLYYWDENGERQLYYPAIAAVDPYFDYQSIYSIEKGDSFGTIYKLVYLTTAIGTAYFNERIDLTGKTPEEIDNEHKKFGLYGSDAVAVSMVYIDSTGAEVSRVIKIGDKLPTGSGYYFTVDDRPYIYSTNVDYFSYALSEFTTFISPVLTAEGIPGDNAFEPYLTTDFKHYVNTVHEGEGCKAPGCEGGCVATVGSEDRVIVNASATIPDSTGKETGGYVIESERSTLFDLSAYKSDTTYKRLVDALVGRGAGAFSNPLRVTLPSFSKTIELKEGTAGEYVYTIYEVEAYLAENGDITDVGYAVPDGGLVRVRYSLKINGVSVSENPMHGVLDLSSEVIPEDVKNSLSSVGELSSAKSFTVNYTEENAVKHNVELVLVEIKTIVDKDGNKKDKVAEGTSVLLRYHIIVDGVKRDGEYTMGLDFESISELSEGDAAIYEKIKGMSVASGLNLTLYGYTEYDEIMADFILYEISGIDYFVKSECVASFEFQQASDRDPFYGESIYKNTLTNQNSIYALNSSVCETIVKILGGITESSSTTSSGLVGNKTIAVGITPDIMKKYGLYANTIYFEIPRGIEAVGYNSANQSVNDYLNTLDDYIYYDRLGFTLYISDEQPDGTRYIASDLYDIVAQVDGEDFIFLEYDFVELYARRNLLLTNISNIKNVSFDFFMEEVYGSYSAELTHQKLYAYGGGVTTEDKLTEDQLAQATPYDAIRVYIKPGTNVNETLFSKFYFDPSIPSFQVGGSYYGASLSAFYDNKLVELDTLGTSNFKELMEMIFYTRYEGILTAEEQAAALLSSPCLMKMTVTLGKPYSDTDTVHSSERNEGIYEATSSYDYAFEFYRVSDRKIMVKIFREARATGEVREAVSDFYISTLAFKKIVGGYMSIMNKETIDNDMVYPELPG